MSVEAFVWIYRNGEPATLPLQDVLEALGAEPVDLAKVGDGVELQLCISGDIATVDVVLDHAHRVRSLTVCRPLSHTRFYERLFDLLRLSGTFLFYSDDTRPRRHVSADVDDIPEDLLAELGEPIAAVSPNHLRHNR